ncbi:MAG: fumarylacetoacetate hydrolase family protein [Treponema sp.]|jgi:2-keto-4-pentenoate hydratase/2-oxohepta-3-ene-1,7-dioic acid hydratase in catechol pathway|nr:fumarylacetoacetate hydrolase family protein [Treponema sp.]
MIALPLAGTDEWITIAPSKIIAVGLNYRAHVRESSSALQKPFAIPLEPVLFAKTPNVLIGPGEPIIIPGLIGPFEEPRTDPEAELGIIIAKKGKHIPEDQALDYVLGYTCFNDVSQRNIQNTDVSGWFRGKSFDTFGPIGPVVVRPQDLGNPQHLAICSRINGVLKQSGNTADMIFPIPRLIAYISRNFTLQAGDIIATGTPSGISPLHSGDIVEVEIEGIGILRNPVIAEAL